MAKPDKDDGFFQLAYELTAAAFTAGFTDPERLVIFEVIAQVYGLAKLPQATLGTRDIARRSGTDAGTIGHAIADLVAGGVLAIVGDGYRFVKDYEAWDLAAKSAASARRNGRKARPKPDEAARRARWITYVSQAPSLVKSHGKPRKSPLAHRPRTPRETPPGTSATALALEPTSNHEALAPEPTSMLIGCWQESQQSAGTRASALLAPEPALDEISTLDREPVNDREPVVTQATCVEARVLRGVRPELIEGYTYLRDGETTTEAAANPKGSEPNLPDDLRDIPHFPVLYDSRGLASDDIEPRCDEDATVPAETRDDRLADWVKALVTETTGDETQGEHAWRDVGYWRKHGASRPMIAAYVAEACGPKYPEVVRRGCGVARFFGGAIKKRQPEWGMPPVPREWAEASPSAPVAGPASEEDRAIMKRREAVALSRREAERSAHAAKAEAARAVYQARARSGIGAAR